MQRLLLPFRLKHESCSRDRYEALKAKKGRVLPKDFYLKVYHSYGENENRGSLCHGRI